MASLEIVQQKLDTLPTKPGVYLFKDQTGKIIYVGKAINLRSRVRSYFHEFGQFAKTVQLVQQIADLETIIVGSELEALILEMNLIKKHRPKYNVRLKDDKRYPYIKVHYGDPFPKVTVTRRMEDDGSEVLWPLHQRVGGAPDARRAAQDFSLPHLRSRHHRHRPARLPVLRHQAVPGPLHRR